ncbi:GPR1/FUN34/YaaH-class plasma membrane protein [Wilcoxina mikolae CBS 423.85]|nr:GPR1/FUN34/YaaH-class plasma membrane protein [Wilcoxina mikolae CBS 423.85]
MADISLGNELHHHHDHNLARTATISTELFEKLYLSPKISVQGQLRQTFANPTPLALAGFLMTVTPLACQLIGWRGADGSAAAIVGAAFFCGGLCMFIGGLLEFFLGNTFSFVVFCSFGGFWFSMGATVAPPFGAISTFQTATYASGAKNPQFYNTFAFYFFFVGILSLIFLICSVRTNIVFFGIFLGLVIVFQLLAGTYWQVGNGNAALAGRLQIAAGAVLLGVAMLGWYIFMAVMLAAVDFPFDLPVGDLSSVIKGGSERRAALATGDRVSTA